MKKVAVIGLGYVGLPLALLAEAKGHEVIGIDIDRNKLNTLSKKESPFYDAKVSEQLKIAKNITFSSSFEGVRDVDIVIVCVPTPVKEGYIPDLSLVEGSVRSAAPFFKLNQLIVLESTVNPGVSEDVVLPIIEEETGLKVGKDIYLAHCPERINPGDEKWNVENINRVLGACSTEGLKEAVKFYESILVGEIKQMGSLKEAEAVKVVENSFRDVNIAFVNELARSFSILGIDVVNVIDGAATKPFAFMAHYPGCGVGGHCIPVDPYYLIEYAKKVGFNHDFLSLARRINHNMPKFTIEQLTSALNLKSKSVKGSKVALLGLSYKADIDDCRESPAFEILEELHSLGADVKVFDPYVLEKSNSKSLEEALNFADAIVLATSHKEFRAITPELLKQSNIEVVIDGRNFLNKKSFEGTSIVYRGIGR